MEVLIDVHSHSKLSFDGSGDPMDMAKRALGLGVSHFAITDHIEIDEFYDYERDYPAVIAGVRPAYEKVLAGYGDKMKIYFATELGQPLYDLPRAEKIIAENDFDFIIGSVHRTENYEHMSKIPDTEFDRKRVIKEYFEEMLALCEWGKFCTLGHITFLMRFVNIDTPTGLVTEKTERSQATFDVHKPIIDKILETIIKNDIALEVNSSGYRRGLGCPMPSAAFIKRYKELGGKMITVGSDAHILDDIAIDIPQCIALIREIGFDEICVFEKKNPVFIKI
ncbi:MAG: histidinol-phosphatase HisJ family protein [Oscillospiraceae bacterium]|nr:histidinol-phosphatase HisJ family protein [Oscillospiraceae bacterium]